MQTRYELKYVVPPSAMLAMEAWLRTCPAGFRQAYPDRVVNTIYFDGAHFPALTANIAGIGRRTKVRLRWYGEDDSSQGLRLECKERLGFVGTKRVVALPDRALKTLAWHHLSAELNRVAPPDWTVLAAGFHLPMIRNRYRRRYYVSSDGAVRLTLDRDLSFFMPRTQASVLDGSPTTAQFMVVEAKFADHLHHRIAALFRDIPARNSRFSKYLVGTEMCLF